MSTRPPKSKAGGATEHASNNLASSSSDARYATRRKAGGAIEHAMKFGKAYSSDVTGDGPVSWLEQNILDDDAVINSGYEFILADLARKPGAAVQVVRSFAGNAVGMAIATRITDVFTAVDRTEDISTLEDLYETWSDLDIWLVGSHVGNAVTMAWLEDFLMVTLMHMEQRFGGILATYPINHRLYKEPAEGSFNRYGSEGPTDRLVQQILSEDAVINSDYEHILADLAREPGAVQQVIQRLEGNAIGLEIAVRTAEIFNAVDLLDDGTSLKDMYENWSTLSTWLEDTHVGNLATDLWLEDLLMVTLMHLEQRCGGVMSIEPINHRLYKEPAEGSFNRYGSKASICI